MNPNRLPPPRMVMTASDVDELPNGRASIFRVWDPDDRGRVYRATIDRFGYVRELSHRRRFFPAGWEVVDQCD